MASIDINYYQNNSVIDFRRDFDVEHNLEGAVRARSSSASQGPPGTGWAEPFDLYYSEKSSYYDDRKTYYSRHLEHYDDRMNESWRHFAPFDFEMN